MDHPAAPTPLPPDAGQPDNAPREAPVRDTGPRETPARDGGARAFQVVADPAFLWLGAQYGAAMTLLRAAIVGDGGLLALTGPAGAGKTVLTQALAADLSDSPIRVGRILYPNFEGLDFLRAVALSFGLPARFATAEAFATAFDRFLADTQAAGKRVLLIIDEAHTLPLPVLDTVRSLPFRPDPAGEPAPSFQLLLAGQPELLEKLRQARLEPDVTCRLHPLTREQIDAYIGHRLRVAGVMTNRFSAEAVRQIWTTSGGIPRVINALCSRALGTQSLESRALVTSPTVLQCAKDLQIPPVAVVPAGPPPRRSRPLWRAGKRAALGAVAAAAVIGAIAAVVVGLRAVPVRDAGVPTAPAAAIVPARAEPVGDTPLAIAEQAALLRDALAEREAPVAGEPAATGNAPAGDAPAAGKSTPATGTGAAINAGPAPTGAGVPGAGASPAGTGGAASGPGPAAAGAKAEPAKTPSAGTASPAASTKASPAGAGVPAKPISGKAPKTDTAPVPVAVKPPADPGDAPRPAVAAAQPAARVPARDDGEPDPARVIDWLLERYGSPTGRE
jgi:type II secretory pathway predicted ATPase ExeA